MRKQIIIYGLACGIMIFALNAVQYRVMVRNHAFEIYAGFVAIVFTLFGIWIARKITSPKVQTVFVAKKEESHFATDEKALEETGISKRELEVLQLMEQGLSNKEIADRLFVSLNTIKTHSSKLFAKLNVNRRTQAIIRAKELRIIR